MSHNDSGSDQKARVQAHVRAMVDRLVRTRPAPAKPINGSQNALQEKVKADREQEGAHERVKRDREQEGS